MDIKIQYFKFWNIFCILKLCILIVCVLNGDEPTVSESGVKASYRFFIHEKFVGYTDLQN